MDWSKWNPYRNEKGSRDRFYDKTGVAKHREWRGAKDTFYDFIQWLVNLGIMGGFVAKSPVRILKGMVEYRWMGSYLASLHWIDKCMEGLQGPALRVAHTHMHAIMKGSTTHIANAMKGDRRFGDTPEADRQVLFEQTMAPEVLGGFPNLTPMSMEAFQGLLGCYMDQSLPPFYLDIMEHYGLPADSCRLSATAAGVAINDDFPKNGACLIVNNMPCDSSTMNSQLIERRFDLPVMVGALPMRWEDEKTDKYALSQMKKIIAFIEMNTGERFDEAAFLAMMEKHNAEVAAEMEKWEYMRTPYTPYGLSLGNLFHTFLYAFSGGRLPYVLKAERKGLAIAAKAYEKKINCFPKARHRAITWGGPGCYNFHFANWLYNCWGILTVAQMDNFEGNVVINTDTLDDALVGAAKSYEHGIMRRHLTGGYQHLFEFWEEAEKFCCDIVVLFDDITCKGALGLTGMINEQSKAHPDIHLMTVSNDMFDHRTISRNDMRHQVNEYMTAVLQEQPLDATLLDFDDDMGW